MGEYSKALPLLEETLTLRKKVLGEEHPDTLASMNNLGGLCYWMGDSLKAYEIFKDAHEVSSQVLGDHSITRHIEEKLNHVKKEYEND
jgi:hypothetical protein